MASTDRQLSAQESLARLKWEAVTLPENWENHKAEVTTQTLQEAIGRARETGTPKVEIPATPAHPEMRATRGAAQQELEARGEKYPDHWGWENRGTQNRPLEARYLRKAEKDLIQEWLEWAEATPDRLTNWG